MTKKRKHNQLQDPDDSNITKRQHEGNSQAPDSTTPAKSKGQLKQEKSERRAKKQKSSKEQGKEQDQPVNGVENASTSSAAAIADVPEEASTQELKVETQKKEKKKAKSENGSSEKKTAPARFIVFVGNLPYDVTVEQIKAHFSKISPMSVRHATNKGSGKGKGFTFLEFDNYDKMKTCLKLYHHSLFEPDSKEKGKDTTDGEQDNGEQAYRGMKKRKGRRINVELTTGGGGKSKERKARIKSKNEKLEEERERRRIKEKAEREKAGLKTKAPLEIGANAMAVAGAEVKDNRGDIHPSRLSRVRH